jgi:hypothetical protein
MYPAYVGHEYLLPLFIFCGRKKGGEKGAPKYAIKGREEFAIKQSVECKGSILCAYIAFFWSKKELYCIWGTLQILFMKRTLDSRRNTQKKIAKQQEQGITPNFSAARRTSNKK